MDATTRGQPPKILRPGVREKILSALSKGATYNLACGYGGVAYNTFREWMKKGEPLVGLFEEQLEVHPDKVYHDFYCDVRRVESYTALKWLEKIDRAADIHWQAAAWKLERRHPLEFGRVTFEAKEDAADESLSKARSEVSKLKGDENGRSSPTEG